MTRRVLFISHSHPAIQNGGTEIAAFNLFRAFDERSDCEAWFFACSAAPHYARPGLPITQPFSEREYLYAASQFDSFKFANRDAEFPQRFEALLRDLRPDVVHFHHYLNLGVEAFQIVRRALPDARIVLTLHEYLAICHHHGQMITSNRQSLCEKSSLARCHDCFPEHSPADFFLRKLYIQHFFNLVDHFIAPSRFLAERYVAWGLPAARMSVIENLAPSAGGAAEVSDEAEGFLRIGFFGQISWLKGCNVLLDAAEILAAENGPDVRFDIHGDYRGQKPEFQAEFLERLRKCGRNVAYHGPYENKDVDRLMRGVEAVLAPSVWWENSPVVIQEARRNRRPVLCSDIGGMAEKIRDGIDGFHFRTGDPASLAALIRRLARNRNLLRNLRSSMAKPNRAATVIAQHLAVYGG